MAYMLAFDQADRRNIVGVFECEENAVRFLESIPFIQKQQDAYGTAYCIPYRSLPDSYSVQYHGWKYVLSRFSYSACEIDGDIEAVLIHLCELDSTPEHDGASVDADTLFDAYVYRNGEIDGLIEKRKAFYQEAVIYYGKQGRKVSRAGLGTEDGEYLLVSEPGNPDDMRISTLLEPQVIAEWEKAGSFEAWRQQHKEE